MVRKYRVTAWRNKHAPTVQPMRCQDGHRYCSCNAQPGVDQIQQEYCGEENEESFSAKVKEALIYTVLPLFLGLTIAVVFTKPYYMLVDATWSVITQGWEFAWHFGETGRVVKQPDDHFLKELLEESGFKDVTITEPGTIKFRSEERQTRMSMVNEKYRVKLIVGFDDVVLSPEMINDWNSKYLYTRIFLDKDGEPVIRADMFLGIEGVSRQALIGFCKVYSSIVDDFEEEQIASILQSLLEKSESENRPLQSVREL